MDARAREVFKRQWSADAIREAGERLQWLVKNGPPPAPGAYIAPYCGVLPAICKENMARRLAKRRAVKSGVGNVAEIPPATAPAWVHRGDPKYSQEPSIDQAPTPTSTAHPRSACHSAPLSEREVLEAGDGAEAADGADEAVVLGQSD